MKTDRIIMLAILACVAVVAGLKMKEAYQGDCLTQVEYVVEALHSVMGMQPDKRSFGARRESVAARQAYENITCEEDLAKGRANLRAAMAATLEKYALSK